MKKSVNLIILLICYIIIIALSLETIGFWQFIPIFVALTAIQALMFFINKGDASAKKAGIVLISLGKLLIPMIYLFIMMMILIFSAHAGIGMISTPCEIAVMIVAFVFELKATNFLQIKNS